MGRHGGAILRARADPEAQRRAGATHGLRGPAPFARVTLTVTAGSRSRARGTSIAGWPFVTTLRAMPVRDYASKTLISVRPETSLVAVQEVLLEFDISAVPVIDECGELKGILTTTDLLREAKIEVSAPGEVMRITPPARTARDLMRRDVITVDESAPLGEAATAMASHRIHRVVVTRNGAPVSVLSTRDAMRAVLFHRVDLPLSRVMTTPVETIAEGDTIRMAIQRLADVNVRGLVVVDGTWPIGVFTHTEAMHAHALPSMFLDTPVERVMSYETICLDVETPLYRVAGHATHMKIRRVLAVHDRQVRGIVSGFDLVRVIAM
jgi:predicted transcriptional regulator